MKVPMFIKILLTGLRVIIILIPVFLFSWLIYKDLIVSGELKAVYNFNELSPFITTLRPQSRVTDPAEEAGIFYQQIKEQPVYFDVRLPRYFDTATVKLVYKNIDQSVFELGALVDKDRWIFDLQPVDNRAVNFLFSDKLRWSNVSEGNTVLFQKNLQFKTINEFLKNLPPAKNIAVYNYKFDKEYQIEGYNPRPGGISINRSLRGLHRMYTYIKDEALEFNFWIQDVNRHLGDDFVSIDIYQNDKQIYSEFIQDDGNATDNLKMSDVKKVSIYLPDLKEGVYKIEFVASSDDIFIRKIETKQDYLVFINQVYLADEAGFIDEDSLERSGPAFLWTDGHIISAETSHIEGIQDLAINNSKLSVFETHKSFNLETSFGIKTIVVPKNDIRLNTKGLFSFSESSFFNPELTNLADGLNFDQDRIDYVITNYTLPKTNIFGWQEAEAIFEVGKYYTEDNMLHFAFSLPYLTEGQEGVSISLIEVELKKKPLTLDDFIKKAKKIIRLYE